jgi:hypothetical protein
LQPEGHDDLSGEQNVSRLSERVAALLVSTRVSVAVVSEPEGWRSMPAADAPLSGVSHSSDSHVTPCYTFLRVVANEPR